MIGGDAVAEQGKHTCVADVLYRCRLRRHVIKVRGAPNVGGIFFPGVRFTLGHGKAAPALVTVINLAVAPVEHVGRNAFSDRLFDFALRGPEIGKIYKLTVFPFAQGVAAEIEINSASQGKCHHQRRRHQVIGTDLGVDPAFKVSIA